MNQKLQIKSKRPGVVFSEKEKQNENKNVISNLDKRINDLLHKIEFTDATQNEAFRIYMKLQGFLRKRRALKNLVVRFMYLAQKQEII